MHHIVRQGFHIELFSFSVFFLRFPVLSTSFLGIAFLLAASNAKMEDGAEGC